MNLRFQSSRLLLFFLMLSVGGAHVYGAWHGVAHAQVEHHEVVADLADGHANEAASGHSCLSLDVLFGGALPITVYGAGIPVFFSAPCVSSITPLVTAPSWLRPAARAPPLI